jgi:hypothetical protein
MWLLRMPEVPQAGDDANDLRDGGRDGMSGCDRCGHKKKDHAIHGGCWVPVGQRRCGCPVYLKPGTMRMISETAGEAS